MTVHATVEYASGVPSLANDVWNVRSATLTTVMSRIDMIAPSTTTPATLSTAASIFSGYSMAVPAGEVMSPLTAQRRKNGGQNLTKSG